MSYNVFLVAYLGAPRNHHGLFIRTDLTSKCGILLHVKGDIQNGMKFEEKSIKNPETSATFVEISPLGWVATGDLDRMRHICMSIPPPKKQFNGSKRLYPKEPLRRCQEWTNEAIDSLTRDGVLEASTLTVEASVKEEYWNWSGEYQNWYHMHEDGSYEWATDGQSSSVGQTEKSKDKSKDKGKGKGKGKGKA